MGESSPVIRAYNILKRQRCVLKKFILLIIIAAILGVGGAIAAVMLNKDTAANEGVDTEYLPDDFLPADLLKTGKYYLNGDKNSDLWVVVTPDFLQLQGKDVDKSLMDAVRKTCEEEGFTDEVINRQFEEAKVLHCAEKIYLLQDFLPEESKYTIRVSRDNKHTDPESLKKTGAAFIFNLVENTIYFNLGDFILVEDQ